LKYRIINLDDEEVGSHKIKPSKISFGGAK